MEIERKFLVGELPPELSALDGMVIRQGYVRVADRDFELRFRQKDNRFYQTIKQGSGLVRRECEIEITREQFESLWPLTAEQRIQKVRYNLPAGDLVFEIDLFKTPLTGLQMVEVEFETVELSSAFNPPQWFGNEVTDDRRYKNKQLATHGLPKSPAT
jgi:CYTH domain-containing protein